LGSTFVSLALSFKQPKMLDESLKSLIELSARIGQNLDLVQAGGGNTSVKEGRVLWVKASGKWLSRAAEDDMFLPVPMPDIDRQLSLEDEKFPEYRTRNGQSLRPSVETAVHAVLPQSVVIHVHSVRTIAWASRLDGQDGIGPRLSGLNWSWIPYTHPGIPLAIRIRQDSARRPDVLILENHGLVVAADDFDTAENLLHEVERRLDVPPRFAEPPDQRLLQQLTHDDTWELAFDPEVHALATDSLSSRVAAQGTLFPDQCVYLGPAAALVESSESLAAAAQRYQSRYNFAPAFLLVPGAGVVTKKALNRAAQELLVCLKRVVERIPLDAQATYLPPAQVARLMNWDAEKYRIAMAKKDI
jgi:rhamnose utilization protein RhaD (predicted bifunctional aldolase and dehydrogenase)